MVERGLDLSPSETNLNGQRLRHILAVLMIRARSSGTILCRIVTRAIGFGRGVLLKRPDGVASRPASLVLAALLVIAVFPDVVFNNASLSMVDIYNVARTEQLPLSIYPERNERAPHHGFSDTGGAALQSEPAQQFMRHVFYDWQSPYWNPYSAAGSLGPETLVDIKFSPLSVLTALAGGSSFAFHASSLALYVAAVYSLLRALTIYFRLSMLAALASATVFLMNGYSVANLSSNVSQSVTLFPIALYGLLALGHQPSVRAYLLSVFGSILILSITFLPTTLLTMGCISLIAAVYAIAFGQTRTGRRIGDSAMIVLIQASSVVVAFLSLSFLYFPIAESLSVIDSVSMYSARVFFPANYINLLSLFTPKHFWESYNAIDPRLWDANFPAYMGNVVFHIGIVPAIVAAYAMAKWAAPQRWLVISLTAVLVIAVGRIFAVPGIYHAVDLLFGLRSIGSQYWGAVVAIVFVLIVGFGMDALGARRSSPALAFIIAAVIVVSAVYIAQLYELPDTEPRGSNPSGSYVPKQQAAFYLIVGSSLLAASLAIGTRVLRGVARVRLWQSTLIVLMFAELAFYMNHTRPPRADVFVEVPDYIEFLKKNAGSYRVMNLHYYGLPAEFGSAFQIQQIESMNMNILPNYYRFFERNFLPNREEKWGQFATSHLRKDRPFINEVILDLLAVKYVLIPATWVNHIDFFEARGYPKVFENRSFIIFENTDVYPRIFATLALSDQDLTPDVVGLSPRQATFSQDARLLTLARKIGIPDAGETGQADRRGPGEVRLLRYDHTRVVAEAKLDNPGVVVLMDNWHPNWKAYVNGEETYVGRVNESFRGIALPAGLHRIEMTYAPATLPAGLVMTFVVVCGMLILLWYRAPIDRRLDALRPSKSQAG